MIYILYFTVVFLCNIFVTDLHALSPSISKYINITTMVGETLEIKCSVDMESQEFTAFEFTWLKNGKSLHKKDYSNRMSLGRFDGLLKISNVNNKDEGTYECHTSNEFQSEYLIYTLIVIGLPKSKNYHARDTWNLTIRVGDFTRYLMRCNVINVDENSIENFIWLKDGQLLFENDYIDGDDKRIRWTDRKRALSIGDITYEDKGIYECLTYNKFRTDSVVYNVNIIGKLPNYKYTLIGYLTNHLGEKLSFSCCDYIMDKVNYTWSKNDKPLIFSEDTKHIIRRKSDYGIFISNITFDDAGIYKCTAYRGLETFSTITVNVIDYPEKLSYRWYTSNIRVITRETLHLSCYILQSTTNYTIRYSWKKNGENVKIFYHNPQNVYYEDNKKFLKFDKITSKDNGTYECKAESRYFKVYSVYTLNIVDPEYPVIYNSSISISSVSPGEPFQLYCYARGIPTPAISWLKNDVRFDTSEKNGRVFYREYKQQIFFNLIEMDDAGTYKCKVTNILGSITSTYNISIINDKKMNNEQINLILIFLTIFSVLLLSGVFMIWYNKRLRKEKTLKKKLEANKFKFLNGDLEKWNADLSIEDQTHLLPYYEQCEFPKNKLKLGKQLGSGAFGVVYKADAFGINSKITSTTVAVKMVKLDSDSNHIKALTSELKIMIHIGKHLNIVNLLGACTEDITKNLMLIVEFCRFGNIREFLLKQRDRFINQFKSDSMLKNDNGTIFQSLHYQNDPNKLNPNDRSENTSTVTNSKDLLYERNESVLFSNYKGDYTDEDISPLSTQYLISWCYQISRGMEYLSSKKVIHGDLAIRNVLLADHNVVKICDFGLAKVMHNYDFYKLCNKVPLPVKWLAIESIRDQVFSTKSDVWSFGIVLWEIFSLAETPYPDIMSFSDLYYRLVNGYRLKPPEYGNRQIYKIMYDCWEMDPNSRPSFSDLTERISDLLEESSKSHYVQLNERFYKINTNTSPSNDYANILSSQNRPTMSDENLDLRSENYKFSENNHAIEMKLMVHNQCYK